MNRIFICAERFFPRGDAGANRVLYIAKAMQLEGWKVVVLSIGNNKWGDRSDSTSSNFFEGVEFENIVFKTQGIPQKLERMFFNGVRTVRLLKKHKLNMHDKVLIYSSTFGYVRSIYDYSKKKVGAAISVDVVEWHQPFQFKFGKFDPRYRSFKRCFTKLFVEIKNVVVISRLLEKHFDEKGCNVLRLPIYIEPRANYVYTHENNKLNLVYPGNPYRKDSLETMLRALSKLNHEEKKTICLHLTGVSIKTLKKSIPGNEFLLDMECVKIHDFIEYKELMYLFEKIDFALISRPKNKVTLANFPSKVPELMSRGIPVIMNKVGDIKDFLHDNEDSIFIKDFGVEFCLESIRQCLAKSPIDLESMHKNAFSTACNVFDYRRSCVYLDEYFRGIK